MGNLVYVPLPNADERASIIKAIAKKKPIDPSVDLDAIAKMNCEDFSGADLANLVILSQCFLNHETMFCNVYDSDNWFEFIKWEGGQSYTSGSGGEIQLV